MFDYEGMIKRAISFFPTWSDIRKRHSKSTGGKLLDTITEQSLDIDTGQLPTTEVAGLLGN